MKPCALISLAALLMITAAGYSQAAGAKQKAPGSIKMRVGDQKVFEFSNIQKITVGDPRVADVKPVGDNSFIVFAVGPGKTNLLVLFKGKPNLQYNIEVESDMKRITVNIRYADGNALESMLRPYLTKKGVVRYENRTRTLTLVDKPEVVDVMLKMVKQFDVKPPQLQFSVELVLAEKGGNQSIPPELKPVAKQLKEVFNYNKFTVMDKAYISVEANQESRMKVGGENGYTVDMSTHMVQGEKSTVRLGFHLYNWEWIKRAGQQPHGIKHTVVSTTVEMKDGETAILGASMINGEGKALITVVSMKMK
jgi:hypothetical protein